MVSAEKIHKVQHKPHLYKTMQRVFAASARLLLERHCFPTKRYVPPLAGARTCG
ncbi:hypothetical protein HMPREF3192_00109 [Atopobium deltae]|uniref:Uncharacterized protein n=1 Tax=Atopobium deltae TaxID=1393034 RepID=A0A133XXR2_9ACTN|nr:hypothetical protein HMPREF3192_00109 [Atopobium deltae]